MHNLSLVWFTLLTQSAVGLIWVDAVGRWCGGEAVTDSSVWPIAVALIFGGSALVAALFHLARPGKAPQAIRNVGSSWLSREIISVSAFAGALALLTILGIRGADTLATELAACILGAAALLSMIRVYLIRTVPVWNTLATPLEFVGSALILGGGLGLVIASQGVVEPRGWNPPGLVALGGIALGLVLKIGAISPTLAAERSARAGSWYEPPGRRLSTGRMLGFRLILNLAGTGMMISAVMIGGGLTSIALPALACLSAAEILGRWWFYGSYMRVGL